MKYQESHTGIEPVDESAEEDARMCAMAALHALNHDDLDEAERQLVNALEWVREAAAEKD